MTPSAAMPTRSPSARKPVNRFWIMSLTAFWLSISSARYRRLQAVRHETAFEFPGCGRSAHAFFQAEQVALGRNGAAGQLIHGRLGGHDVAAEKERVVGRIFYATPITRSSRTSPVFGSSTST